MSIPWGSSWGEVPGGWDGRAQVGAPGQWKGRMYGEQWLQVLSKGVWRSHLIDSVFSEK